MPGPGPSEPDVESRYCPSVSEAGSGYASSISAAESACSDAGSQVFDSASSKGEARPLTPTIASIFRSVLSKCLPCIPCLRADLYDDDEVASISPSDPIWSHPIFGKRPPDTMPVIVLIEEDFKDRMKAKTQAAIQHARQKDEALHARIHSKMPKCVSLQEEIAGPIASDPTVRSLVEKPS
ncbi:hypothetical protein IW262DRAFT_1290919 [Armillaria fumosa]|nr:hypothetical protein IW262DRAFT_1290919 [Armillaria fumosa]